MCALRLTTNGKHEIPQNPEYFHNDHLDSRKRRRICSASSPTPAVCENDLRRLAAVQFQIVPLGPVLNVGEFRGTGGFVACRDNQISDSLLTS